MNCGCDCGSILVRPVAPISPLEIVAADDIIAGWDAAVRVETAGAVSVLPDVSGNGFNLTQAVAANQPTAVVGGGPNGNDSILFDGVDDIMVNAALDLPAPGTTPTTYWAVFRQITWAPFARFWEAGTATLALLDFGGSASPDIAGFNNTSFTATNGAFPLNTYQVVETSFTFSNSDAVRTGGVIATGQNAGPDDPTAGFILGGDLGLINPSNIEVCELWIFGTVLTTQQRSQLRAYATNRYGLIP